MEEYVSVGFKNGSFHRGPGEWVELWPTAADCQGLATGAIAIWEDAEPIQSGVEAI